MLPLCPRPQFPRFPLRHIMSLLMKRTTLICRCTASGTRASWWDHRRLGLPLLNLPVWPVMAVPRSTRMEQTCFYTWPIRLRGSQHAFPPSTPPSQHALLPTLTPNLGTPGQQFNFADFVNVTPSPAQPAWGGRTPGNPGRTPLSTKDARKRLNFDALVPPSTSSPRLQGKETGLALQLGGVLRP
jgi:hypothetical protein